MKDRSILKPIEFEKLKGSAEAHQYRFDEERQLYIKNIRLIKGLAKAKSKAPKYMLAYDLGLTKFRLYITGNNDKPFTSDKNEALYFHEGFDDPNIKTQFWSLKYDLKLFVVKYL